MTLYTARDLSSQVVAIPMTFFGMLMNSPHSEFQKLVEASTFPPWENPGCPWFVTLLPSLNLQINDRHRLARRVGIAIGMLKKA
jgi:hypothetical protein